jgi:hypothetical protein
MKLRRWLIVVVSSTAVGAAMLTLWEPWATPHVSWDATGWTGDAKPSDLYLLTVGVEPNLTAKGKRDLYAADAWFVRQALAQAEPLYATTHSRVLAGEQATRTSVLAALAWLGKSVAERDVAVLFFSTHGSIAPPGRAPKEGFYIDLAGAGTSANVKNCVLWGAELNAALAKIRGRTVLLLDTCQAGGVIQADGAKDHQAAVVTACATAEDSSGPSGRGRISRTAGSWSPYARRSRVGRTRTGTASSPWPR